MLRDDPVPASDVNENDEVEVLEAVTTIPSPTVEGIVDVISLRGLVRAVKLLRRSHEGGPDSELDRAVSKMINLNGAAARAISGERR